MKFKAAIFDMDGTLVDSLGCWDLLWKDMGMKFLDNENFKPEHEDDKKVRTLTLEEAMFLIHEKYNIAKNGKELYNFATQYLINFYKTTVKCKNGVYEFLDYLKKSNIKMCVASATASHVIDIVLDVCNLRGYFDKIFSCGDIGKGKEHPDVFLAAKDFLDVDASQICVFEDSLVSLQTVKSLGMQTVGIFDKFNYNQEEIKRISDCYIEEGETLLKVI